MNFTMKIISQWLDASSSFWLEALLGMDHDLYQLPGYVVADAHVIKAKPKAFHASSGSKSMLLPLLVRDIPSAENEKDSTSPYGYGGPVFSSDVDGDVAVEMLTAFKEEGRSKGLITTFLRMNPLLNVKSFCKLYDPDIVAVTHGETVSIDLSMPVDDLNRSLRNNHRRDIKKLRGAGFTARFNHWEDYSLFQKTYSETMERLDAADSYRFSASYFELLKGGLGDNLILCSVLGPNGEVAGGGLFGYTNGIAQYHLGATGNDFVGSSPTKLMFVEARDHFKSLGASILHLGGGLSSTQDSLFRFKQGFGSSIHTFQTMRIVHDRERFEELNRHRALSIRTSLEEISDFFPPYRYQ